MSNNINTLQDRLDDLTEDIKADADLILGQIDIDKLIEDTENYIREFAEEFVHQHEAEISRGIQLGHKFAKQVLKRQSVKIRIKVDPGRHEITCRRPKQRLNADSRVWSIDQRRRSRATLPKGFERELIFTANHLHRSPPERFTVSAPEAISIHAERSLPPGRCRMSI
jgi:hypothetical protein